MAFPYVDHTWAVGNVLTIARMNNLESQFQSIIDLLTTRGDITYRGAATWERLAKGNVGEVLTQGANDPAWGTAPPKITSGTYVGNDAANRAIPHGLGVVPKIVIIHQLYASGFRDLGLLFDTDSDAIYSVSFNWNSAVTAMSTTNFYVGNVADYEKSANANAITYRWVAIG